MILVGVGCYTGLMFASSLKCGFNDEGASTSRKKSVIQSSSIHISTAPNEILYYLVNGKYNNIQYLDMTDFQSFCFELTYHQLYFCYTLSLLLFYFYLAFTVAMLRFCSASSLRLLLFFFGSVLLLSCMCSISISFYSVSALPVLCL